jgi:hypothetical protein
MFLDLMPIGIGVLQGFEKYISLIGYIRHYNL